MIDLHLTKGVSMSRRTTFRVLSSWSGLTLLSIGATLFIAGACAPAAESEDAAASTGAAAKPAPSRFGDYGPATPPFDGRTRHSLYIPMKDGVEVAVDYYLPTRGRGRDHREAARRPPLHALSTRDRGRGGQAPHSCRRRSSAAAPLAERLHRRGRRRPRHRSVVRSQQRRLLARGNRRFVHHHRVAGGAAVVER